MMKIIIFVLIFNGILITMCKNEVINVDNTCEERKIECHYNDCLFCENLNITNYTDDIEFILDNYRIKELDLLTFKNCTIPNFSIQILNKIIHLVEINLIDCKIENVGISVFYNLNLLSRITFKNNFIKELKSFTFTFMGNENDKVQLYLTNNKIENIQEYCFRNEYISKINLKSNLLTEIENKMFSGATSLNELNLSNNLIKIIKDDSFLYRKELKYLYLSHNKLTDIEKNTFKGLKSLRLLDLSYNLIKFIDSSAFQSMKGLELLSLDHNNLKKIEDKTFCNLIILIELQLNHNEIENIGKDSFLNSDNLKKLFLNNNKLKSFNDTDIGYKLDDFDNGYNKKSLNLSMNLLKTVYFGNSYKLHILDLSSNNIKDIYNDTFEGLKLETLILSNNKIKKFDTHVLYPKTNLRTLYIDGNQISEINYEDPKFRFLEINLLNNKWNCTYLKNMIEFFDVHEMRYIINEKPNTTQHVAGIACTENDHHQQKTDGVLDCTKIIKLKTSRTTAPNQIIIIILFCILIISAIMIWIYVLYRNKLQICDRKKIAEIHSLADMKDNI